MTKAIFIDVEKKEVSYIELAEPKEIAKQIGCEYFCCPVTLENNDTIYVDDESLLFPDKIQGGFAFAGWNYPLVGNAIILGANDEGDSIDCKTTIEEIKSIITFLSKNSIYHIFQNI